jgi:Lar family restriction alleviation protein
MAGLKSCPFCGSHKTTLLRREIDDGNIKPGSIQVVCGVAVCFGRGPWKANEAEATTAWNRRAPAPAAPQGVEEATNAYGHAVEAATHSFWNDHANNPEKRSELWAIAREKRRALEAAIAAHVASEREAAVREERRVLREIVQAARTPLIAGDRGRDMAIGRNDACNEIEAAIRTRKDTTNG